MAMTRITAESFAARVLAWLTEDHARIAGFLSWSGDSAASLRSRIQDPALLSAVIDYLLLDEAMLRDACADLSCPPETPLNARAALPGGNDPHWT